MRDKQRAPTGDIHFCSWALEAVARGIGEKIIGQMSNSMLLIDKHQGDPLLKRPRQQGIVVAPHNHEEQGDVGTFTHAVAVQVHTGTHAVAVSFGVEWLAIERHRAGIHGVALPAVIVADLPYHRTIKSSRLHDLKSQIHLGHSYILHGKLSLKVVHQRQCFFCDKLKIKSYLGKIRHKDY